MSELKAFDIVVAEEGYCEGIVTYRRAVYDKSEADKVFADKDKAFEYSQAVILVDIEIIKKQKRKRCLAMAEWCKARYDEEDAKLNRWGSSWDYVSKEMKYWERWQWRWDALADKFKEVK